MFLGKLNNSADSSEISTWYCSIAVGIACCAVLLSTSRMTPLVWDEPNAILRAEKLEEWLVSWGDLPDGAQPWKSARIRESCPYTTQHEGHPAFYGFVIAVGHLVSHRVLPLWESYRFGPILLFSVATASLFHRMWSTFGKVAAGFSVVFLLTMPRLFAHAHFASIDGPLTSCWILTWVAFPGACQRWRWTILWGVLLGMTMSCKLTGWLAIFPFAAWSVWQRDRRAIAAVICGGYVSCLVFFYLNPPLWHDPVSGFQSFLSLNLSRLENGLNIPTQFFGKTYDLTTPLPWYNGLAWTVLTVPPGTLLLAALGCVWPISDPTRKAASTLILMNWATFLLMRALPITPPHDAERLILPAFPFLAAMAGIGASVLIGWARSRTARSLHKAAWSLTSIVVLMSGIETAWYSPQWLSYYTPLVGGLHGAAKLGFEPAYYWDGLDSSVLCWLQDNTHADDFVYCRVSQEFEDIHTRTGQYHYRFTRDRPERCTWYVVQNRPGLWTDVERVLVERERPAHAKTVRSAQQGFGPWRLDVPVVLVYSVDQYRSVRDQIADDGRR